MDHTRFDSTAMPGFTVYALVETTPSHVICWCLGFVMHQCTLFIPPLRAPPPSPTTPVPVCLGRCRWFVWCMTETRASPVCTSLATT